MKYQVIQMHYFIFPVTETVSYFFYLTDAKYFFNNLYVLRIKGVFTKLTYIIFRMPFSILPRPQFASIRNSKRLNIVTQLQRPWGDFSQRCSNIPYLTNLHSPFTRKGSRDKQPHNCLSTLLAAFTVLHTILF